MSQQTAALFQHAQQLAQAGQHAAALALYRQLGARGVPVHQPLAGCLMALQQHDQAIQVLQQAIADGADPAGNGLLIALVQLEAGRQLPALQTLDHCLQLQPAWLPALRKRATLLAQMDRLEAACTDYQHILQQTPDDAQAAANLGVIHLRRQDYQQALPLLQKAAQALRGHPQVLRSLANCLRGLRQNQASLQLFSQLHLQHGNDPALLADHALALIADGQYQRALAMYQQALQLDPGDAWALMGAYLAANQLGNTSLTASLMDYPQLLGHFPSQLPAPLRKQLLPQALTHPRLRPDPLGKSTQGGQQSSLLDLSVDSPYHPLLHYIEAAVSQYMDGLPAGSRHHSPWLTRKPDQWRLQAWITVLQGQGGHQRPHIHPAGWLSGVTYLDAGDGADGEGELHFGHPTDEFNLPHAPFAHRVVPADGALLLFPSYFLHHTTPYYGKRPRVSIAFDLLPG